MIKFTRNENADICGTSFHGVEIKASVDMLTKLLGKPVISVDDKTTHEWVVEGDDGSVVTIYDYKYDGSVSEYWHVGAHDKLACLNFVAWFNKQSVLKTNRI